MNLILDILFPKKCIGCGKTGSYFCEDCVGDILQKDLICPECDRLAIGGQTHSICRKRFTLDGLWSLGIYQGSLKKAIQKLKYEPALIRDFAPELANIILTYWAEYKPFILDLIKKDKGAEWAVIPVPLHWFKENKRGFNQASLIGQLLSKSLGLAYCNGLKKVHYTNSQVKLKGQQRRQNIRDAFAISSSFQPLTSNILLIDDVWTTGSTLRECCYTLKKAGAKKVWAITLAR